MKKVPGVRNALAALMVTAGGCSAVLANSGPAAASSSSPFVVLLSATESGAAAQVATGDLGVMAAKAAVSFVNKHGGVDGHKVQLEVVNDAGDPTTAVSVLEQHLNGSSQPNMYINTGPANNSAAVVPILTQKKILSWAIPATGLDNASKYPYNFVDVPGPSWFAQNMANYAKSQGYKSVALMYSDDSWGTPEFSALTTDLHKLGITITGQADFEDTAVDVTPQLEKLKSGNPQALLVSAYTVAGDLLQGVHTLQWNVPVAGDTATADATVLFENPPTGLLGSAAEANFKTQAFRSAVSGQQFANAAAMTKAIRAEGTLPTTVALATPYDGVMEVAAAANQAKSIDTTKLVKAIVHLRAGQAKTGVWPAYPFTSTNHSPNIPQSGAVFIAPAPTVNGVFVPK